VYRDRIVLHLLRVHADIRAFRWRKGRLPNTPAEVDRTTDPGNGQPWVYEVSGPNCRLASAGRPQTGEITLTSWSPPKEPADPR
jgi:hypothetical protein